MQKTPQELYIERDNRINDSIALKIPDRVPVALELSYFPASYTGIKYQAAYYDYEQWLNAYRKTLRDFEPDLVQIVPFFPGKVFEILDPRQMKWPGHGVAPNCSHQFIEGEYMKADEYDIFMEDHTDYMLRCYLPRTFGALESFSGLPPFWVTATSHRDVPELAEALASPKIYNALEKLLEAGREMARWSAERKAFGQEIENMGFPLHGARGAHVPFDIISYQMRGLQGIYLDMFRQPDKLIEVFDNLLPIQLKKAVMYAQRAGRKRVFWALHRGADGFMSKKQFEKFYWPYVKKTVQAQIDAGLTPCLFLEGDYTSRLEYFLEFPKGKVLGRFDCSDIKLAKEILGGHMCIMGNVPSSILSTGTPQDVEEYCKMLIDEVGKDGGLIVAPSTSLDTAKAENVKRMVDFTKEYGKYS